MSDIVCVINSCNLSKFREFLDFVLGISAFNDDVSVVFMKECVPIFFNASSLKPVLTGERDFIKTFGMLDLYDINNVFVEDNGELSDSVRKRLSDTISGITCISSEKCYSLICQSKHVFTF